MRKRRKIMLRAGRALGLSLAFVSLFGFFSIIMDSLFNIDWFSMRTDGFILLFLGFGLIFEGKLFKLFKMAKNGITGNEYVKWITSIVGLMLFVAGFLTLISIQSDTLDAFKGVGAIIAFLIILIETIFVD